MSKNPFQTQHFFLSTPMDKSSDHRQHDLHTNPNLLAVGQDLLWRQDETVGTGVPQLESQAPLGAGDVVDIVRAAAVRGVDRLTCRTINVLRTFYRLNGFRRGSHEIDMLLIRVRDRFAAVAVRAEDQLRVAVPIDE